MKFKIVQNLENGKSRYYFSRGKNYTAVSLERFHHALIQYFPRVDINCRSYCRGCFFITEFDT